MLSLFTDVSDVMSYHASECECWAFLMSRSDVSVGRAILMSRSDISTEEDLHGG